MKTSNTFNKHLIIIVNLFILNACQSVSHQTFKAERPRFYDQGFNSESLHEVESVKQIFHLEQKPKDFVRKVLSLRRTPAEKMEALVHGVFDRSKMNLLYRGDANTLANETFESRAANCLSMSIMMYALAKEAGFHVKFQEVIIPEYWTRRQGYSLLNGHINLRMSLKQSHNSFLLQPRSYQVDFDPQSSRKTLPKKIVSKQEVVAMFYNNKGADALLHDDFQLAYRYFRQAISLKPRFQSAWVNMGILYRHMGYFSQAENAYQYAISLNAESLTAWENLAHLYGFTDRKAQAEKLFTRIDEKRRNNPYYHLNLGEEQLERENWDRALAHFRKALSLDRSKHETYFGLARVYFEIGELAQSERYLKQARNTASNHTMEGLYQDKINFLHNM